MINIDIFYKSNQDGDTLLNLITEHCEQARSEPTQIDTISFHHITIKDDDAKFNRTINPPQAQMNCMNKEIMRKILSRNNIRCKKNSRELLSRIYDILLFDTTVLSIKQRIPNRVKKAISYIKSSQCREAVEFGKRAAYHLGLDFALVKIAFTVSKQYLVVDIEPSPTVRSVDLQKLITKIMNIRHEDESVIGRDVKLGADPEFMLSRGQRMIPASVYFPHHGKVGCDNIRTRDRQNHPIGELRPSPSISPLRLTENLKTALHSAIKLAPSRELRWIAGSRPFRGYPIGGHIHFSNIKLNFAVLRSLDNFLAIPVLMLEHSNTAALRRRKYGALADFRVKHYGGFEYRTLSSWLVSPQITKAILCLAKIIATHYLELNQNFLNTLEAQQAFYKGDKEYFKPKFDDLWSAICKTDMYSHYPDELQVISNMINNGESWNEKGDFRKAWGVHAAVKKKIEADVILKKPRKVHRQRIHPVASRQRPSNPSNRWHAGNSGRTHGERDSSIRNRLSVHRQSNAAISGIIVKRHFEPRRNQYRMAITANLG